MSNYKIGYARVSTIGQDEALQLDALQRAQVNRMCVDRASGTLTDRPGLVSALEWPDPATAWSCGGWTGSAAACATSSRP